MPAASSSFAYGDIRATFLRRMVSAQSSPAPAAAGQFTPTSKATRRAESPEAPVRRSAGRSLGRDAINPVGSNSEVLSIAVAVRKNSLRTALCPLVLGPGAQQSACMHEVFKSALPQHAHGTASTGPAAPSRNRTAATNSSAVRAAPLCGSSAHNHNF